MCMLQTRPPRSGRRVVLRWSVRLVLLLGRHPPPLGHQHWCHHPHLCWPQEGIVIVLFFSLALPSFLLHTSCPPLPFFTVAPSISTPSPSISSPSNPSPPSTYLLHQPPPQPISSPSLNHLLPQSPLSSPFAFLHSALCTVPCSFPTSLRHK